MLSQRGKASKTVSFPSVSPDGIPHRSFQDQMRTQRNGFSIGETQDTLYPFFRIFVQYLKRKSGRSQLFQIAEGCVVNALAS